MKSKLKTGIIIGVSVILVVALSIVFVQSKKNNCISLEEQVETAQSDVQVQEKRRVDLVYNLVDCVKEYDKHESDTLKSVVDSRTKDDANIEDVTTQIKATAEAYPELKSSDNYKQLMNELSTTENLIAQHRSTVNKEIKEYNRYTKKFPVKQLLGLTDYEVKDYEYLDFNAPSNAPQNLFDK